MKPKTRLPLKPPKIHSSIDREGMFARYSVKSCTPTKRL